MPRHSLVHADEADVPELHETVADTCACDFTSGVARLHTSTHLHTIHAWAGRTRANGCQGMSSRGPEIAVAVDVLLHIVSFAP
eukprot:5470515-Alexandrium_andersonii.AAC.1